MSFPSSALDQRDFDTRVILVDVVFDPFRSDLPVVLDHARSVLDLEHIAQQVLVQIGTLVLVIKIGDQADVALDRNLGLADLEIDLADGIFVLALV